MTEEKTKEIVPLIFDKAFKAVFIKEDDILIKMIKDIFPIPKSNNPFTMVGFETVPPSNDGKTYRGDILIKLSDNSYVSIEMNTVFEDDIFNRNIIHLVRIHNQILKEGESNKNISRYRMMQLNLNLNDKYDDKAISRYAFCNMDNNKVASLIYTICNINLAKGEEIVYNLGIEDAPKAVRWGAILSRRNIEEIENLIGDDLLTMEEKERFINRVKEVNENENLIPAWIFEENARLKAEQEREFAIREGHEIGIKEGRKEGRKEGIKEGRKEGIKEGRETNQKEVIINLLKKRIDYETISDVTGKSVEEIKKIEKTIEIGD